MTVFRGIALLVATLVLTPMAGASAEVWVKDDPRGDGSGRVGDIARVRVANAAERIYIRVATHDRWPDSTHVFIDTRALNAGPEFAIFNYTWGEDFEVRRTDRFGQQGNLRACRGMARNFIEDRVLTMSVPRHCLAIQDRLPGRIRVAVRTTDEGVSTARAHDWAPGKYAFGRWIAHG